MARESIKSYSYTRVAPGKSKEQIEALLVRVGAVGFRWISRIGSDEVLEAGLKWNGRELAFRLSISFDSEDERKQKLRALYWYLKSKVEAIEFGLVDLEHEFLPSLITSSGETVYEHLGGENMKLLALPEGNDAVV